ncbi:DUF4440 domain-containing protein [Gammaproteobacteria bacterium]|nr:DUF4440 domain-containing protein [Gammaproteobacteria bacterium]
MNRIALSVLSLSVAALLVETPALAQRLDDAELADIVSSVDRLSVADARERLLAALRDHPDSLALYNALALVEVRAGNLKQASETLEQGLAVNEEVAALFGNLVRVNDAQAGRAYRKALVLEGVDEQQERSRIASAWNVSHAEIPVVAVVDQPSSGAVLDNTTNYELPPQRRRPESPEPLDVPEPPQTSVEPVIDVPTSPVDSDESVSEPEIEAETIESPTPGDSEIAELNEQISPIDDADQSAVESTIEAWRTSWNERDADGYASAYVADYSPQSDFSHADWIEDRRANFSSKRFIRVTLDDLAIEPSGDDLVVTFGQHYESDNYQDRVQKQLQMRREGGQWLILVERTL